MVHLSGQLSEEVNRVAWQLPCGTKSDPLHLLIPAKRRYWLQNCTSNSGMFTVASIYKNLSTVPSPNLDGSTLNCSPEIGVSIPKICMAHYGQTLSAQLVGYRNLQMSYLMPPLPILLFPIKQGYWKVWNAFSVTFAGVNRRTVGLP